MSLEYIKSFEEFTNIVSSGYVVVNFTAQWCGPCKQLTPKLEELLTAYPNIMIYKVDVDECVDIAEAHQVEAMPTTVFFKDGEIQKQKVMGADIQKIRKMIAEIY
jgi:thioredoxin 1